MDSQRMTIDVVSDTICPWCYVGKRRLERAMAERPDIAFTVRWHPYRLDPTTPREGVGRMANLIAKFGDEARIREMGAAITEVGQSVGIAFAFDKIAITPATMDSHRLILWAAGAGLQDKIVEALFEAYFTQGRNIGHAAVLTEIAAAAGMTPALVAERLAGDLDCDRIAAEDDYAHRIGITGVPTFIFADKFAFSGAQEPETFLKLFEKVLNEGNAA